MREAPRAKYVIQNIPPLYRYIVHTDVLIEEMPAEHRARAHYLDKKDLSARQCARPSYWKHYSVYNFLFHSLMVKSYLFLFQKSYGISETAAIEEIKSLYQELNIPTTFKQYEDQCYDMLHTQIQQSSRGLPHRLFFRILEKWIPYQT